MDFDRHSPESRSLSIELFAPYAGMHITTLFPNEPATPKTTKTCAKHAEDKCVAPPPTYCPSLLLEPTPPALESYCARSVIAMPPIMTAYRSTDSRRHSPINVKLLGENTPSQQLRELAIFASPTLRHQATFDRRLGQQQSMQEQDYKRVPSIFVNKVTDIGNLLKKFRSNPATGKFAIKSTKEDGIRVQCDSLASHSAIMDTLREHRVAVHTHQPACDKGFRVFIRHLHKDTRVPWISPQLCQMGLVRVVKQRFSGKPLNLWEVVIGPQHDRGH